MYASARIALCCSLLPLALSCASADPTSQSKVSVAGPTSTGVSTSPGTSTGTTTTTSPPKTSPPTSNSVSVPGAANATLTAAQWNTMMASARPGAVIDLGTRRVTFSRIRGLHDVTFRGGIFSFTTLDQWKNVTFDGTRFEAPPTERNGVWYIDAYQPDGLTIRNATFVGWNDANGLLTGQSINIRGGQNVTIVGSTFRDMANFITIARTTNVNVSDNDMTNVREGVRYVGTTHGLIMRNRIGPFRPAPGDHADGVQFFSASLNDPTDHATWDTTITDNLIISSGAGRSQGIFVRDELNLWQSGRGYDQLTIVDNLLVGTGWHGIAIGDGAKNVTITGNKLLVVLGGDTVTNNWIMLTNNENVVLKSNQAGSFILKGNYVTSDNRTVSSGASAATVSAAIAGWDAKYRPGKSYANQ